MSSAIEEAQEEAKTDMTPMIDAVFLLIIFFLCIDFKVLESKLPAYLPKDKGSNTTEEEPVEQLPVRIVVTQEGRKRYRNVAGNSTWDDPRTGTTREAAYMLEDHKIRWDVGPKSFTELDELKKELERIYKDRSTWQPDKENPGEKKPMPIVIEPQVKACYVDVANTVDAVTAAGFKEVNFGGGMGSDKAPRDQ